MSQENVEIVRRAFEYGFMDAAIEPMCWWLLRPPARARRRARLLPGGLVRRPLEAVAARAGRWRYHRHMGPGAVQPIARGVDGPCEVLIARSAGHRAHRQAADLFEDRLLAFLGRQGA
jgi:hypothetical protein